MKLTTFFGVIIGVIMTGIIGAVGFLMYPELNKPLSGVSQNDQYEYTQYTGAIATTTTVFTGKGVFGSVIITEDAANATVFWDATSSAAITDGTYATRIADLQASLTEGTYIFDVGVTYGLIMQSTDGFTQAGDWTVTWRRGW